MSEPECFGKIYIFQDLEGDDLRSLVDLAASRHMAAGEVIIREGESGDSMFIMCEGEVEITKRLTLALDEEVPKERVMIRLKAEDGVSFGEMALLENESRSATVTAVTDCHVLEMSRQDFLEFLEQRPMTGCKILLRLAQLLSQRLRKSDQNVVKLTTALAIALGG
jgi:CRP-like cAMP-binding protein